jgi:hypothetical protein
MNVEGCVEVRQNAQVTGFSVRYVPTEPKRIKPSPETFRLGSQRMTYRVAHKFLCTRENAFLLAQCRARVRTEIS